MRPPGPQCSSSLGPDWIDAGTLTVARSTAPTALGADGLSPEESERLLDLTQIVLDLTGIADPTPISDGTNAVISVGRGDWLGAGLSGLGLIPYIGDLAKVGKLGRWAQTIQKTVALARRNARFAERVRPILRKLADLLDQVPVAALPESARATVSKMKADLGAVLAAPKRIARAWVLERYVARWYKHIDELEIVAPPRNRGVLWSRLDRVQDATEGAVLAERLAVLEQKVTLEMTLKASKFAEKYQLAVSQLAEQLGVHADDLWNDFGKKVWTRISKRYANSLEGRVSAYVRLGGAEGLQAVVSKGREPIFIDELWELSELLQSNTRITSVDLVDVVSGARSFMTRDDVLRAIRGSH